ncbi:MAG TPA: flippase [Ktedonobacterales bacterium]|jgi:O-antigen/teichoic acid export membrane protein|nr:flippase [Ktedonobacterales bacterium]
MRVVRNIIALFINQVGNWIITLVLTIALPRYLGVNEFGLYSFALAFVGFFALGMKLGTGTYLSWRIPREPEMAGRLTFNTLLLQLPLILVCSAVAIIVVPLLDDSPLMLQVTLLLLLATSISSLSATLSSGLTGLQIMKIPAFIMLGGAALDTGLVLAGMHFNISLVVIAAFSALSEVAIFVVMAIYALPRLHLNFHIDPTLWRAILLGGLPFFAWSVVLLFYWQVDITMIKAMVPHDADAVVGWYAAASRLTNIPLFLPMIVVAPLLPALSAERNADSPKFRDMVSRSLRLVTLVALPAGAAVMVLSNQVTDLLHYPKGFEPVSILLRILALNVPLVAIDMILGTALIAAARQRAWTVVGVIAGIFNPLVNLWAIPFTQARFGNAAIGAAVVTVATELVMFGGALYLRPKGVFSRWDAWYAARCLIATAVMVPVVILFSRVAEVGLFASMIYGAITYAAVAYSLKLVRDDEILSLVSIVTSRVGVQLPFKGQTGTFARIPVVGADPSESLENPLHTTEWAASASASSWLAAAASAPVLSSENWVNIIYSDDDLDETALHETIPMHIAPTALNGPPSQLHSSGVR